MTVLDTGLPDGVGSDLIAELRELYPGSAVLVLSASLDAANLARAKEAGADEIMDKFAAQEEFVDAVRRLRNG